MTREELQQKLSLLDIKVRKIPFLESRPLRNITGTLYMVLNYQDPYTDRITGYMSGLMHARMWDLNMYWSDTHLHKELISELELMVDDTCKFIDSENMKI